MNAAEIKNLLNKYSVVPEKSLGQNFLIDKNISEKIIKAGDVSKKDTVLEIGAGVGCLTIPLSEKAKKVIAVEKDEKITPALEEVLENYPNVEVLKEDALSLSLNIKKYKIVANIPYYITSLLIQKFLEQEDPASLIVLTVQKEVAERICAKPPRMNLLAVSVQFYATPKIIHRISKNSFWPIPKVDSAIIKIEPNKEKRSLEFRKKFFSVVKRGFSHPRKQLRKNLNLKEEEVKGIDLKRRAETLTLEEWEVLTNTIFYEKNNGKK
jgi:16S rRNA (adenine1518-N6/adenine1519-N6)-dimethyltransferase